MLKYARQADKELNSRAGKLLRSRGITKADFMRSALRALVEEAPAQISTYTIIVQRPAAGSGLAAPQKTKQERGKNIHTLQKEFRALMGDNYCPMTEEEKKALLDDFSGEPYK